MGKKLASGGFGTVYRGSLRDPEDGSVRDVIIKKAKEFGEAEVGWGRAPPRATSRQPSAWIRCRRSGSLCHCAVQLQPGSGDS